MVEPGSALKNVFERGLKKVESLYGKLEGKFPHITEKGKWLTNANGHWTGGFWTGLLWMDSMYNQSGIIDKTTALNQAKKLKVRISDNKTHDMGFIFGPSCVFGNRIQPDDELADMAVKSSYNLLDLFEEKTGLIQAWREPGYEGVAIVDTIMNIPLMIWAGKRSKDKKLFDTGMIAADHIQKEFIRKDHSVFHMVRWDTKSYKVIERTTHQGYRPDTCWSRGQAWALYGFSNMYRYTENKKYLETSQKLSDFFWRNTDDDSHLPRWDFFFKNNVEEPLDTSAASIAATGMILLSKLLSDQNEREEANLWKERAEEIIQALIKKYFNDNPDSYGIIKGVTVDKPRNSGINESSMYGDYYFMEALYRLLNYDKEAMTNKLY